MTDAIQPDKAAALGFAGPQTCALLKFDLLRDAERILNLDPEITHGALQLRVAKRVGFILRISFLIENQRPAAHRLVLAVATGCAGR